MYAHGSKTGVHLEEDIICEYKDGVRCGKATEDTRLGECKINGELYNILYVNGRIVKKYNITNQPDLAFYKNDIPW